MMDFDEILSPSSSSISNPSATPPAGLSAGAGATPTSMPVLQPAPNNLTNYIEIPNGDGTGKFIIFLIWFAKYLYATQH